MSEVHRPGRENARVLKPALIAVAVGAAIFWAATFATFLVVDDDWWSGTTAERAAVIDENMSAWRATWAITMPGELLVGTGLAVIGWTASRSQTGTRRAAWTFVALAGLAHLPIAVARFATSLSDGAYAADPGVWFDILWGAQFFGLIASSLVLAWLGFSTLAPRWACAVMAIFALLALPMLTPSVAYFPGLTLFAALAAWRLRARRVVASPTPATV